MFIYGVEEIANNSNLQEDLLNLYKICKFRAGATPEENQYHKWMNENRDWLNKQLQCIGRKYKLIWNVKQNGFVEINLV